MMEDGMEVLDQEWGDLDCGGYCSNLSYFLFLGNYSHPPLLLSSHLWNKGAILDDIYNLTMKFPGCP